MKPLYACLSWGSLVWNPHNLPAYSGWHADGPFLPIEFARMSKSDRITLVILYDQPNYRPSRSLWTLLDVDSPQSAKEVLRVREDAAKGGIGLWEKGGNEPADEIDKRIARWATQQGLDAVVWTKLGPQWVDDGKKVKRMPSLAEVKDKLREWEDPQGTYARLYMQMAPGQIDTPYRREIFKEFGWKLISNY